MQSRPLLRSLNIYCFPLNLNLFRGLLLIIKKIIHESVSDTSFANPLVSDQYDLVIEVSAFIIHRLLLWTHHIYLFNLLKCIIIIKLINFIYINLFHSIITSFYYLLKSLCSQNLIHSYSSLLLLHQNLFFFKAFKWIKS